jgi:hypothetical protein
MINLKLLFKAIVVIALVALCLVAVVAAVSYVTYNPAPPQTLVVATPTPPPTPTPSPTPTQLTGNLAITFNTNPIVAGQTVTITVALSPVAETPVTLYADGNSCGTVTSNSNGLAVFTIPNVQPGSYVFTATAQAVTLP